MPPALADGDLVMPVDALRVDLERHFHGVAAYWSNLGAAIMDIQPFSGVVRPPTWRRTVVPSAWAEGGEEASRSWGERVSERGCGGSVSVLADTNTRIERCGGPIGPSVSEGTLVQTLLTTRASLGVARIRWRLR